MAGSSISTTLGEQRATGLEGAGSPENFASKIFKYAVFDMKSTRITKFHPRCSITDNINFVWERASGRGRPGPYSSSPLESPLAADHSLLLICNINARIRDITIACETECGGKETCVNYGDRERRQILFFCRVGYFCRIISAFI